MAVVEPGDVDAFLAICEKWDVDATVIGEVTDEPSRLQHRLARRDRRRRTARARWRTRARRTSGRSPGPTGRTRCRPTAPSALPRPATGDELRETLLRLVASPNLCDKSWITDQYDRYVQGNTVLAQPEDAGMVRVDEETGLGVAVADRLQRPVRQARPVRRRAARAGRGLPQRRDRRRHAARDHRLPQLRLARGPRRDVAVRRGHAAGSPTAARARHPGDRRQRQPLQPDRRRPRSCPTPVVGRARRDRRRHAAYADRLRRARASRSTCSARPRDELVRLGVGARRARPPRRAAAARSTWPPSSELAEILVERLARRARRRGARPLRRRARPGAGRVLPAPRHRRPGLAGRRPRPVRRRCSASRRAGRSWPCRAREEVRFTDMCAARGFPHARIGVTDGIGADAVLDVQGQFNVPLSELRAAWSATLPAALG